MRAEEPINGAQIRSPDRKTKQVNEALEPHSPLPHRDQGRALRSLDGRA